MADDTTLVNVDDDAPAPAPVAAAPAAPPPAVEPPAPPDDPDEAEAVELPAGKHVPLAALKTVREENKTLKERAQQAETLAAENARLKGQLEGFQQVTQQLRQPQQAPAPQQSQTNEAALLFARGLDLYTQDGSGNAVPDVQKAAAILGIVEQIAEQKAGKLVMPVAADAARRASAANYQWALQQKDANGRTVPKAVIDEMWSKMPLEHTAQPEIARTLWLTGLGMATANQAAQPAVPPPPVVTEAVGGNPRTRPVMSALEQNIAAAKGIKAETWQEHTKGFKPGHTTVLEP